jgi:cellulose synthase/poly-beta-1,6-N-acetylglucosamine synthase-like glycosyltransferase
VNLVYLIFAALILVFTAWTLYNIPVLVVGVKRLLINRKSIGRRKQSPVEPENYAPMVSIIVPVRNEEKVVSRLLQALLNLNYPESKFEVIVVNDGSSDRTSEICKSFESRFYLVRVFSRENSTTKAAALNFGVPFARGEIIATFDADSVPERDALLRAASYFRDPTVAAVQGRICSINAGENMLTRFLSFEGAVQYEVYLGGKDELGLFVGMAGTCQFVRRSILEAIGGWDEGSLCEDIDLSLKLVEKNYVTRYATDVRTWEESPNSVSGLVRQRARWYRGNIRTLFRFGRLMAQPGLRRFDAEMFLLGTLVILLCVVNYVMAVWSLFMPPVPVLPLVACFSSFLTLVVLGLVGCGLVLVVKPFRLSNVLWLPFVYAYWGFQSFIALYAVLQIVFRRKARWGKTVRSGAVTAEPVMKALALADDRN